MAFAFLYLIKNSKMETTKLTSLNLNTTVSLTISDGIDSETINKTYKKLRTIIDQNENVNLLMQIEDVNGIESIKLFFDNLGDKWYVLRHLRKYALITNNDWVENIIEIAGMLTPKVEMKQFDMDEKEKAIDWINSSSHNEKHGLAIWPKENYLHLIVYDKLTIFDYKALNKIMHNYENEVSLLVEFSDFEGMTLRAFLEDLKMGFSYYRKFKKIAVVPNKNINVLVKITDLITPGIQFKSFSQEEKELAIKWIEAR
ncbi:STAS/SEC14 domain-containing protein [Aureibaculum marinum]|uniref:STAS/SEC14 domain-containing protein n=2 Tax=Aureibaculum marinum TaxID=2487930 RepID=A0A3N4P4Q9_9FLAO|nr:STAS/SEC14 domain-containing protein [Aureibaculum marinum]